MDYSVGLAQSQRVLKQRNMLGIVALVLSRLKVEQANKKLRAELAEGGHDENPLVVG